MRTVLAIAITTMAAPAHAELVPHVAPMVAASDGVCELLKSERHDVCMSSARVSSAAEYHAGAKRGIRRYVLAIDRDDADTLISPSIDLAPPDDATLDATTPTVRAIEIDGHPGFVLDLVSTFHRGVKRARTTWQTESFVGCGEVSGLWKCVTIDAGSCTATIDSNGAITTSCGDRMSLSLR